jgi:hypothetical protein
MNLLSQIPLKDIFYIIIIILLVYKIYTIEKKTQLIEGMSGALSDEAIQNIASVYHEGKLKVNEIEVLKKATIIGSATVNGTLNATNIPNLKINNLTAGTLKTTGDTTLNNLTANGSTTLKKGCNISGQHPADQTVLTINAPSGILASHFYWKGNDTYVSGGDGVYVRSRSYPSGNKCKKKIVGKGLRQMIQAGFVKIPQDIPCS